MVTIIPMSRRVPSIVSQPERSECPCECSGVRVGWWRRQRNRRYMGKMVRGRIRVPKKGEGPCEFIWREGAGPIGGDGTVAGDRTSAA